MPNLKNSELDKIFSEYERPSDHNPGEQPLTGAEFYAGISEQPFDALPAGEKFIYNLIADATNEVLAEHKKNRLRGKSHI